METDIYFYNEPYEYEDVDRSINRITRDVYIKTEDTEVETNL